MHVQGTERDCGTDEISATVNPMANRAMVFVHPVIEHVPNRTGKRANEQYGDQCFDERMFGVEIHTCRKRERTSKNQWFGLISIEEYLLIQISRNAKVAGQ